MMMKETIRVIQVGLGPIGREVARHVLARPGLELVGAVDVSADLAGRPLAEVLACGAPDGIVVTADPGELIAVARPDIAILCTASKLAQAASHMRPYLSQGVSIVTSCEEATAPDLENDPLARTVDDWARAGNAAVLGTGVNPGFLMDLWPVAMSLPCLRVRSVEVERVQDAAPRRKPFRDKIGAGLTLEDFEEKVAVGDFGHVGLETCLHMIVRAFGWTLREFEEGLEPVLANSTTTCPGGAEIPEGGVRGIHQWIHGYVGDDETPRIRLRFLAAVGEKESWDRVVLEGEPDIRCIIEGGTPGEQATAGALINGVFVLHGAAPGFHAAIDLPWAHYRE